MRKPKGIIFDYGDTILHLDLLDTTAGNKRLLELADKAAPVKIEDVVASVSEISRWIDPAREESMIEIPCRSLNRLIYEPLGITFDISDAELEKAFWETSARYSPVNGIYELLDTLRASKIKAGILSNTICSADTLRNELHKHNLAHRFAFIVTSADYGVRKPHKHIFRVALQKMGLKPSEIWFVGDTPHHDIRGALDAGLYPVWFNWRGETKKIEGDYLEVENLGELRKIIEGLFKAG